MIPKLICFLFGHIIREKAYTGATKEMTTYAGCTVKVAGYTWEYLEFCPRCGIRRK